MALITTRINGTCSLGRGYTYYANVKVWDTIESGNTFKVQVDTYLVNGGTRTDSSGWTKNITIANVDYETLTEQTIKTDNVDKYGGETLIQSKIFYVPITYGAVNVSSYISKNSYTAYDPGYCTLNANVSMPKVASTWSSSLLSLADITQSFTLPINKYVSSYYNVVEVRNSNDTILIKTINDAVNGTSVTFSSSELNTIYTIDNNANQLPLRFYMNLKTYTDSTKTTLIGDANNPPRLTCEASLINSNPTISFTKEEVDEKVLEVFGGEPEVIIRYASDLLFTITATPKNGATISNVRVNNVNATYDNGVYKATIQNTDLDNFGIYVTDSRNSTTMGSFDAPLVEYVPCNINSNWTIERATQISSDLVLNATIDAYNYFLYYDIINEVVVKYSIDNENWTTIPSSSYTYANHKITITNLTLSNIINYKNTATFYLKAEDLLMSNQQNRQIAKGVETFSYGENDLQVNGDLIVADEDGENPVSFNDINSNLTNILCNNKTNIQSTSEQTLISTTLNKGKYLFLANVPINYYGATSRELNTYLYVNNVSVNTTNGVINNNAYTLSRPVICVFNVTNDYTPISLTIVSTTNSRYDVYEFNAQILRLK